MDKIVFNSGNKIIEYDNGKITEHNSDFYDRYLDNSIKQSEKDAIFHSGVGAQFRGDAIERLKLEQLQENVLGGISSLYLKDKNSVNYSLFINDISAVYNKNLTAKKDSESHIIHDNQRIIKGAEEIDNKLFLTVSEGGITSHLAIFDKVSNDLTMVTDGDSFDEYPSFSRLNPQNILFSSKGVGRDGNGNFVEYSPSYILSYNQDLQEINEVYQNEKYSYFLPKEDVNGNLYAIRKPTKEKKKGNLFLDILLIPYKLILAIYYFLESFTRAFTGKSFTENSKNSPNPAKNMDKDGQKIFIDGNIIYADKEYKNNLKHKDDFPGIIPRSYELIKITNGNEEVIKKGVCCYDILSDGSIVYSNGKYVLKTKDNKTEKLLATNLTTTITSIKNT